MSTNFDQPFRAGGPVLALRRAQPDRFEKFVVEASQRGLTGIWKTRDAFRAQVDPDHEMVVLPVLQNGRPILHGAAVRCYVWYLDQASGLSGVTLVDLLDVWLAELAEVASVEALTTTIRHMLDYGPLQVLNASDQP